MSWAFTTYIVVKGIKHIYQFNIITALIIGFVVAVITYILMRLRLQSENKIKNNRESINKLFIIPLIFSAALLSFAHEQMM